jgi:hypothetical protein
VSTTVNIYISNAAPAATDASSSSLPRDAAGTSTSNAPSIVINAGDFPHVNVVPPYAGHDRRGAVGGREARSSVPAAGQRFAGLAATIGSDIARLAQASQRADAFGALANDVGGVRAAMTAQAGKWVHALQAFMGRALGSGAGTMSRAANLAGALGRSADDAQGAGARMVFQASSKQVSDANGLRSDGPAKTAIPVPLFREPPQWDPDQTYQPGDRVAYNGNVYQVPNGGEKQASVEPGTDDASWLYAGTVQNNHAHDLNEFVAQHFQDWRP